MPIDPCLALVGRLLDDPVLESTRTGGARFLARILQLTRVETPGLPPGSRTIRTLVATGATAEQAYGQFTEGDHFVAAGTLRLGVCGDGSDCRDGLVFEAWTLGHDLTRSRYAVDRTRRHRLVERGEPGARPAAIERELEIAAEPVAPRAARAR